MQPYIFPYIGYFQLINAVDKFVILDDVNYINKGWINRNRILINGEGSYFTIPLQKASQNRLIKDILIAPETKWKEKLLKTIEVTYRKAPFFTSVFPLVETVISSDENAISGMVLKSLCLLKNYLNIPTAIVPSSAVYNNRHLKAQEKIIDICCQENASHYINPEGGSNLYNKEQFASHNIALQFLKPHIPVYTQFNKTFVPALSIIDVLMFNSKTDVQMFVTQYALC